MNGRGTGFHLLVITFVTVRSMRRLQIFAALTFVGATSIGDMIGVAVRLRRYTAKISDLS
jgi:hypothetical protein